MEIAVQTMSGYEETLTLARWAESEGLSAFAVADHYLAGNDDDPAFDQLTILGGVARETSEIELCTLVAPLTFRHPAVMLKAAVTLDRMSEGRFRLGVGAGWMEREHDAFGLPFPGTGERFDMLEEGLAYLRAALDPEGPGFEGRHYRLEPGFTPRPLPKDLRLIVGGIGSRRMPRLAGRFADEYNLFPSRARDEAERVKTFRRAAEEAGRDPDEVRISSAFPPLVAETAEAFQGRVASVASARRSEPEKLLDSYRASGIPHGSPEEVAAGIDRLADVGVERIYLQCSRMALDDIAAAVEIFRAYEPR